MTRLPPGFEPVGRIIHFDASGNIDRNVFESEAGANEPPPLSRGEFEALQRDIKAVEARVRTSGVEASAEAVDLTIEGLWPDFGDHRIDRYIAVISRIVARNEERVDSALALQSENRKQQRLRDAGGSETAMVELSADNELLPALVRLRSEGWKAPSNIRVNSQFSSFATIQATRADLLKLQNDPNVFSVEASRDSGVEDLAVSVPFVKATAVHRPSIAERGSHALVGLIDTGIDVLHEAFRDAAGATRIVAVWDQKNPAGPSPKAFDPNFSQDFGTLYTAAAINGLAAAGSVPNALRDPQAHGTHVASIAAGRAVGTLADGVAPDAGIIVVIPDWKTNPGDAPSLGYSNSHVDALHFLKLAAAGGNKLISGRKPIAVNISLGMNAGAHDGNSILEGMFDALSANGREPSFVIVKSAGNERGQAGHARIKAFLGRQVVEWDSLAADRLEDYVEIWYNALDSNEFTLVAPCGTQSSTLSAATPNVRAVLGGNICRMRFTQFHPDNGDSRVVITIAEGAAPIQTGIWQLVVDGTVVRSGFPHIDLWVERNDARAVRFTKSEDEGTLSIPGTARSVICVGACHSRMPLQLLNASSFGLTRDRRAKPDLCAPGVDIVAARANTTNHRDTVAYPGTSMAAPHVTGAIALVMSHREQHGLTHHNAQQFRAALVRTSVGLSGGHHEGFGFGMLDAEQLFQLLK